MRLLRIFTSHPASIGETYSTHMKHAGGIGARLVLAGIACILHAMLPFIFVHTASDAITHLHQRMLLRRDSLPS